METETKTKRTCPECGKEIKRKVKRHCSPTCWLKSIKVKWATKEKYRKRQTYYPNRGQKIVKQNSVRDYYQEHEKLHSYFANVHSFACWVAQNRMAKQGILNEQEIIKKRKEGLVKK